jgi:hypothetical protein
MPGLFDWLSYKQRLAGVRRDLVHIDQSMTELAGAEVKGAHGKDVQKIARAVAGIAHILVNVLDALPGKPIAKDG